MNNKKQPRDEKPLAPNEKEPFSSTSALETADIYKNENNPRGHAIWTLIADFMFDIESDLRLLNNKTQSHKVATRTNWHM